ncbi:MAG: isocitrate/isopropylmalate dehydrogenase family protein [Thaumarchaeota archaeon]|nr:isocitrate/isopropylmalate dehydrogenase family protein [Nitrososphaerota archaeon]
MKRVALIKGDGIGPEVIDAALRVVDVLDPDVEFIPCDAGYEWWKEHGGPSYIPEDTWEVLRSTDACLKGPTMTVPDPKLPKSATVSIRQGLDLYANVRPIKTLPNPNAKADLDFVCVRENTEGLYSGLDFRISDELAISIRKVTKRSSIKVARYSYELLRDKGWSRLIVVNKANILKHSDGLFLEAVEELHKDYPEVRVEKFFIDNMAQQLVMNPTQFNRSVLLGSNLFMDIISELASGLLGGIGLVYSANFGDEYAMFEPAHGTAPDIVGQNKANPTAAVLSAAWLLDYLGERDKARAIFEAVYEVYREGLHLTPDLGGEASTSEMTEAIVEKLKGLNR